MRVHCLVVSLMLTSATFVHAGDLPKVSKVELQPLASQAQRIADALDFLGSPLSLEEKQTLSAAATNSAKDPGVALIQEILDKHCLAGIHLRSATDLSVRSGPAAAELAEQGWRIFLVKVENSGGIADVQLKAESPNALPLVRSSSGNPDPKMTSVGEVASRFLDLVMYDSQPLVRTLSGLELEYRILQVHCRDAGRKLAHLGFGIYKPGNNRPLASTKQVPLIIESAPAVLVRLGIRDDGKPTTAALVFRDDKGRIYPSQTRRLAPDLSFHPQIYRHDGESVWLQPGKYRVTYTRGPEYLVLQKEITVPVNPDFQVDFELKRWVHPAAFGWYSGDHHVHAAGCAHYESPTEGITPEDMIRHILGEDLNVGCCLSWGPCWYHQKRYFEGKTNALSGPESLLRYDVEVSGFPSSHCGHVCLLRLREQDYPGTKLIEEWPSWDLPVLRWAKSQGAVVGFAHSGAGLEVGPTRELPNYIVPPMTGVGANEYLVDIAHDLCDFISTVDTAAVWELNIWYHTLNCGYRCRISGETDFPCIYGDRVGLGRSYVHLDGPLNFDDWAEGTKQGRSYVSDGKSHLLDFTVNGLGVGQNGSEVRLGKAASVKVRARVAALLEPKPTKETERIRKSFLIVKPYWDLERARIGDARKVPVEVVVNGRSVANKEIIADGSLQDVTFDVPIESSSWVCLRIFPSSHTNPVFVLADNKPIRVSRRSAEWCLQAIDRCWQQKVRAIRVGERKEAEQAYDQARARYRKIRDECPE
jgi:hypothetical protein